MGPWRFRFPTVTRRHFSLVLSVLVLLLGAAYVYWRLGPMPASNLTETEMRQFRNTCVREARHANGGGDLVMDDETEAKIGAYCGCVADGMGAKVSPTELAKIADGTVGEETLKKLDATVADCRGKLE